MPGEDFSLDALDGGADRDWFLPGAAPVDRILGAASDETVEQLGDLPWVSAADETVDEATGNAVMLVSLSSASALPVRVMWATAEHTAQAAVDFVATSGFVEFAPGETVRAIVVPIVDDGVAEPIEQLAI